MNRRTALLRAAAVLLFLCGGCIWPDDPGSAPDGSAFFGDAGSPAVMDASRPQIVSVEVDTRLGIGLGTDEEVTVIFDRPLVEDEELSVRVRADGSPAVGWTTIEVQGGFAEALFPIQFHEPGRVALEVALRGQESALYRVAVDVPEPRALGLTLSEDAIDLSPRGRVEVELTAAVPAHRALLFGGEGAPGIDAQGVISHGRTEGTLTITGRGATVGETYTLVVSAGRDVTDPLELTVRVVEPRAPTPGDLRFNEVLFAPDASDDVACDGEDDPEGDQFVELVNATSDDLDLEGVTLAEGAPLPPGVVLPRGGALVIFGSRTAGAERTSERCGAFDGDSVGRAQLRRQPLGLPTTGPGEIVLQLAGVELGRFAWDGAAALDGESWQRSPDLIDDARDPGPDGYVPHTRASATGARFSPGVSSAL